MTTRRFAGVVHRRRCQLHLTQEQVAKESNLSVEDFSNLESGSLAPSDESVRKLAQALDLDLRGLSYVARQDARRTFLPGRSDVQSAPEALGAKPLVQAVWDQFRTDGPLHRKNKITSQEMETLAQVSLMGEVRRPQDFILILNTLRQTMAGCRPTPFRLAQRQ